MTAILQTLTAFVFAQGVVVALAFVAWAWRGVRASAVPKR